MSYMRTLKSTTSGLTRNTMNFSQGLSRYTFRELISLFPQVFKEALVEIHHI